MKISLQNILNQFFREFALIVIFSLIVPQFSKAQVTSGRYYIKNTYGGSTQQWYGALLSWDNKDPHPMASVEKNDPVVWYFLSVSGKPNTYKIINTYPGKWQGASLSWDSTDHHPMISVEFDDPVEWRLQAIPGRTNTYKIISTYPGTWYGGGSHLMASLEFNNPVEWEITPVPTDNFSMIIASDPQWAWTSKTDNGSTSQTDSDRESEATTLNKNHVKSMNYLINQGNINGVIINGDLTAYGHSNEFDKFKDIYEGLSKPMYLGLGNHDYGNNVDDTYENNAANRMVNYMVEHIKSNGCTNYDFRVSDSYEFPSIETTTIGSLSYSWDIGNIHFVQLQNYPIYKRDWSNYVTIGAAKTRTVKITSALNWLKSDLAKARNAGKIIVLNFHDSDDHWEDYYSSTDVTTLSNDFQSILSTYNVAAVFVGHYHKRLGKKTPPRRSTMYGSTPVFYCGSASQSKYLLVDFNGNQMTVSHVSSANGAATKSNSTKDTLFNQAIQIALPKEDGFVTFFNQAGYVAKYTLTYSLNGDSKSLSTGNIDLGNKRRFEIPGGATSIRVKGEGKTGLVWEPWRTTFDKTYSSPPNKCFKSYGTTLTQRWNNNCE